MKDSEGAGTLISVGVRASIWNMARKTLSAVVAEIEPPPTSESPVKILDKALRILLLFSSDEPEWGVTAVAREVGMPKSTVHRVLRVLTQHSFLTQDPTTKRFRLGLAVLELGRRAHEGLELRRIALPTMERVAVESGETVLLQVLSQERDRIVCIERVQQRQGLRLILEVGATAPLHAGCSSKVMLAHMAAPEVEAILRGPLEPMATHTIVDPKRLREDLEQIRKVGYAVSYEETDEGVAGVSVPIRDYMDRVIASLSISGPLTRVNRETMQRYIDIAMDGARQIGEELGNRAA